MPRADEWILIDTSAWIHALRSDGLLEVRKQVGEILEEGRAAICEMVVLELVGGTRTDDEFRELYEDLTALRHLSINESVWEHAYSTAHALRRKGISIPATDQLIASAAVVHSASIFHEDKHFDLLAKHAGVKVFKLKE